MIDSVYAPPKSDVRPAAIGDAMPAFYAVSQFKMTMLFMATFGLYAFYWQYKNWALYKQHERRIEGDDRDIWPIARAIFSIFFVHALLREALAYARLNNRAASCNVALVGAAMVLISIVMNVLNAFPDPSPYAEMALLGQLVLLVPLLFAYRAAQEMMNAACGDAAGKSNASIETVNLLFIVPGAILWVLLIIGLAGDVN